MKTDNKWMNEWMETLYELKLGLMWPFNGTWEIRLIILSLCAFETKNRTEKVVEYLISNKVEYCIIISNDEGEDDRNSNYKSFVIFWMGYKRTVRKKYTFLCLGISCCLAEAFTILSKIDSFNIQAKDHSKFSHSNV